MATWTPQQYALWLRQRAVGAAKVAGTDKDAKPKPERAVAGLAPTVEQPDAPPALVRKLSRRRSSKDSPCILVTIIACGRGLVDRDNAVAGYKGLQDAIAARLGIDDGDGRIRFEYDTTCTVGLEGTLVKIERLGCTNR